MTWRDRPEAGDRAADEVGGKPLALPELVLHQEQLAAQRGAGRRRPPAGSAAGRRCPPCAVDAVRAAGDGQLDALRQLMPRSLHVEAPVPAVRLPRPGRLSRASIDDVDEHALPLADARRAFTTVRSAATVRPPRPITLPVSSSATRSSRTSGAVVLLERLDGHLVRTVDERPGEELEELLHSCSVG